jgi:hypothetical protein
MPADLGRCCPRLWPRLTPAAALKHWHCRLPSRQTASSCHPEHHNTKTGTAALTWLITLWQMHYQQILPRPLLRVPPAAMRLFSHSPQPPGASSCCCCCCRRRRRCCRRSSSNGVSPPTRGTCAGQGTPWLAAGPTRRKRGNTVPNMLPPGALQGQPAEFPSACNRSGTQGVGPGTHPTHAAIPPGHCWLELGPFFLPGPTTVCGSKPGTNGGCCGVAGFEVFVSGGR